MPQGWGFSFFYRPGVGGFELFFARGVNSPIKKLPGGGGGGGGMVRLGID